MYFKCDMTSSVIWQYTIPSRRYGGPSFCAHNLLYPLKGRLLGFISKLRHQPPGFQYLKSKGCGKQWGLAGKPKCLSTSPDPIRAYSWSSTPSLSIIQTLDLISLEQPSCQCRGLMARTPTWSLTKHLWNQPTDYCISLLFPFRCCQCQAE